MTNALSSVAIARQVARDFRLAWRELLIFDVAFQLLRAWIIAPLIALLLTFVLFRAGHVAVSNQDIVGFLKTPRGGLYAALLIITAGVLFLLEHAGMLAVAAAVHLHQPTHRPTVRQRMHSVLASVWRIGQLGTVKIVLLLVTISPLVVLALIVYFTLLTQYDLYYYWSVRPPVFWLAVGIGIVLFLTMAALATSLLVRWSLALPIALFEGQSAAAALAASGRRVRGVAWPIARLLLGWCLGMLAFEVLAGAAFRYLAGAVLSRFGNSLPVLGACLVVQATLLATVSFVLAAGLALIVHRLYLLRGPQTELFPASQPGATERAATPFWIRVCSWGAAALVALSPMTMWGVVANEASQRSAVLITAHRGYAKRAPENTLAALQKAIDIGADYAEIDVHQTADGVVVLLHDRDLQRVAGDSRRLDQLTFAEVHQLDVGSWFSAEFANERVPTLEEAIALCRGKIRLNIELKDFGPAEGLAGAVADVVREQGFESECIVTSLSNEALVALRRHHPEVHVGIIVGQSVGDVNQLDVDALSVRADHLSDKMIRTAHEQDRQVMVWGISGEQQMMQQLRRGVDNLITSDVELGLQVRDRWRDLSDHERLVIAYRLLLGFTPE